LNRIADATHSISTAIHQRPRLLSSEPTFGPKNERPTPTAVATAVAGNLRRSASSRSIAQPHAAQRLSREDQSRP
jgi:hypothetical protein